MKKKLLLVGCGQLGSRHLQAIASLESVSEIHIVDPSPLSLELGKKRIGEISDRNKNIQFFWYNEMNKAVQGGDLCILATQAKGRENLIKAAVDLLGYRRFLVEKIVTQSVAAYGDLLEFCKARSINIWVNCQTRTYNIHKRIKSLLDPTEPFFMADFGGNHGLACNGIHYADLFLFYDGGNEIIPVGSRIDPILHPSKRGKDVFDLSGTLMAKSKTGRDCVISYAPNHVAPDCVALSSSRYKFIVDHIGKTVFESSAENKWSWAQYPIDENLAISFLDKKIVSDILLTGTCELPGLSECLPSHKYILESLLPHFNNLLGVQNNSCPAT